jgi:poly(A) polymerase
MANAKGQAQKIENVIAVLGKLRERGHEAWLNGGCVRDHLLGREPADFDVATSATPDQVEEIFPRSIAVGKAFGVIRVGCRGDWFEVATFRKDGRYEDGRRPESVTFSSAAEDAARRDFTINGMFWDPESGEVRDYVGGRADLERRIVRAIGDPDARLAEDSLRILRAVRFAAQEGFTLDPATRAAVVRHRDRLDGVAAERIREELAKLAAGSPATRRRGIELIAECSLVEKLFPEAPPSRIGAAASVAGRCPTPSLPLFLAAIESLALPDDARPPAWAAIARTASARLRLSNEEAETLEALLACRVRARGAPSAGPARRRILATQPRFELLRELLLAEGGAEEAVAILDELRFRFGSGQPAPWLDGRELLDLGVPPRQAVGRYLRRLTVLALAGRLASKEDAEAWVRARVARGR